MFSALDNTDIFQMLYAPYEPLIKFGNRVRGDTEFR